MKKLKRKIVLKLKEWNKVLVAYANAGSYAMRR